MIKEIYRTYGIRQGFYAGFIPSATRNVVKQLYRWPLMLILPQAYNSVIPTSVKNNYPSVAKISTGLTLAVVDTFIICPFERLKVCLQTKKSDLSLINFLKENRRNLSTSLFRGLESLFYRQIMSWVSFLYSDYKLKQMARQYHGLEDYETLDNTTLLLISLVIGVSNVFIVMPFDMTKTLYQQHSEEFTNKKLKETVKLVYRENGMKGFYYGWQPRLIQYTIHSIFTVNALERMEQKIKNA